MSTTFETVIDFAGHELKAQVKYRYIRAVRGHREGGQQIEPDYPESAEILSVDLIVEEAALRLPEALLALVQDDLIVEAIEDWRGREIAGQEQRAEMRREDLMMEDRADG